MLHHKNYLLVCILLICYRSIFTAQPAKIIHEQYISATAAICAKGFVTLEQALKNIQPIVKQNGLEFTAIDQSKYHMTLVGFNIHLACATQKERQNITQIIEQELGKATQDAINKSLTYLRKKTGNKHESIVLKFAYIGIFQKHIVALFELTKVVEILIKTIENYFKNNIQHLINNGTITSITKHQDIFQPHVSLAKITGKNPLMGHGLTPDTKVADFHIGKPTAIISVQLRDNVIPIPQNEV